MSEIPGFYKLSVNDQIKKIKEQRSLSDEEAKTLSNTGALKLEIADKMVENV
ncbi:3-hydroxy-3-methylglutaryl-CoA reductase, partial [Candidatus Micrarchaeota archaeon]|nr:3-hydroxy-3-methylglutaryl-CoA reductase [Candidatus Micrarchaeota archaeon]